MAEHSSVVFLEIIPPSSQTFNCFHSDGKLKSYNELKNALNGAGSTNNNSRINGTSGDNKEFRLDKYASFFKWNGPEYDKGKGPGNFDFLKDQIIVESFDNIMVPDDDNPGDNVLTLFSNINL